MIQGVGKLFEVGSFAVLEARIKVDKQLAQGRKIGILECLLPCYAFRSPQLSNMPSRLVDDDDF